ncbi:flocculation protein FLO11 [Pyrus x bretschneideri]|uniref:flocculation protein FLO11 n=1 Tax=Pyrus x bretschneideri TaxID=225117 RepID=UPI00202E71FC|nr:flocculation protein FLO11 [Pyrus x bretschneideri]
MTSMAEIQKKTITPTPSPTTSPTPSVSKSKSSCFLACFGFSRQTSHRQSRRSKSAPIIRKEANYIREDRENHKIDIEGEHSTGNTSQRSWYLISWSSWRFHTNKSATKTVPIDASGTTVTTITDKRKRPCKVVKFSSLQTKSKSGNLVSISEDVIAATTNGEPPGTPSREEAEPPPVVSDPQNTITQNPPQTNTINLGSRNHLESPKDGTCQNLFCRKIHSLRTNTTSAGSGGRKGASSNQGQPGSPAVQEARTPKSRTRTTTAVLSHSVSFPARESQTQQAAPATPSAVTRNFSKHYSSWSWSTTVSNNAGSKNNNRGKVKAKGESSGANRKNLDPLVGMSIILVTLIIMLVWGRLCAILCTSAWFYFIPRLRSAAAATATAADGFGSPHHNSVSNVNTPRALDMNSEECKKKVVLEGFLERNHRNIIP